MIQSFNIFLKKEEKSQTFLKCQVNESYKPVLDIYQFRVYQIIQQSLLNYSENIKNAKEGIYDRCEGLIHLKIDPQLFSNTKNQEYKILIETPFQETLKDIQLNSLTIIDKIKILIEICSIMNKIHQEKIYGIDLSQEMIYISKTKKIYLGIPLIFDPKQFKYSYPSEFYETSFNMIDIPKESDIYSFGILLYEIIYEKQPYTGQE